MELQKQRIRRLEAAGCRSLRELWEEAFAEDTKLFNDYYFDNKAEKNNALILEEDGKLLSMVSMTPYQVCVKTDGIFRKVESTYLVGVATRQEWRRHGFMGRLLKEACGELNAAGQPFAFLQPAAPEIYEPFQFAYIYDKPQWIFQPEFGLMADDLLEGESREPVFIRDGRKILQAAENVLEKKEQPGYGMLEVRPMEEEDIPEVVRFAVPLRERRFQVYTERSAEYYEMMLKEMYAQQGDSFLLLDDKRIVGYFLYSREKGPVIQEALIYSEFEELVLEPDTVSQPAIMGRIISLPAMLSFIRCRQNLDVLLKYEDSMIEENNGFFRWQTGPGESSVCRMDAGKVGQQIYAETSPELLTAFLFGRRPAEECFSFRNGYRWEREGLLQGLERIKTLRDVCINEIV